MVFVGSTRGDSQLVKVSNVLRECARLYTRLLFVVAEYKCRWEWKLCGSDGEHDQHWAHLGHEHCGLGQARPGCGQLTVIVLLFPVLCFVTCFVPYCYNTGIGLLATHYFIKSLYLCSTLDYLNSNFVSTSIIQTLHLGFMHWYVSNILMKEEVRWEGR